MNPAPDRPSPSRASNMNARGRIPAAPLATQQGRVHQVRDGRPPLRVCDDRGRVPAYPRRSAPGARQRPLHVLGPDDHVGRARRMRRPTVNERSTHAVDRAQPLSADELELIDAYWRAANYLSVGQIYLLDNPLLRDPLEPRHIKPRLLGHWGTSPGINFVYAHMNRVIRNWDLDAMYVIGPGHGGPAAVANAYLEGTYSEVYPHVGRDLNGLRTLS